LNKKAFTFVLIVMMSTTYLFIPSSIVFGQLGVYIYQVTPQSLSGPVGQQVNVQGTIDTRNGAYQVWFGDNLVDDNTADGFYVNVNFTVPEITGGSYTIVLRDVEKNANATQDFSVNTEYSAKAIVPSSPAVMQQGSNVILNVTVTGGQSSTVYQANITVMLPNPLSTNYSRQITLTTNQQGTSQTQITFPDASFQPADSITDYAGTYTVYFNQTQLLSTDPFFIGFTNLDTYHRSQSATIRAIGYQPNEAATISISYANTGDLVYSEMSTATNDGIINAVWTVPSDAKIGNYNITITPQNTPKLVPDTQIIRVPGYPITIQTLNLAGDIVPQILVEALDEATDEIYTTTSALNGKATANLENGNHRITAFWNDVKVGETSVSITGEDSFVLRCELTTLRITVRNEDGFLMPFVNLAIVFQYVTTKESRTEIESFSGQTDLSGTFVVNSTLPTVSYTVNASLYGVVFNTGNNTIANLPAQSIYEAFLLCPTHPMSLKVVGYDRAPIIGSRLELVEITSGIFHGYITDDSGSAGGDVTFGKYKLRAYAENILLNETELDVFTNTKTEIFCSLYNIHISVKVVDYFGQPISNAQVVINRQGMKEMSAPTQAGGTATFSNIIGGRMQIITYPAGMEDSYEALNIQIEAPQSIQVKMSKYVLLGSLLIETSTLTAILLVAGAVILFLLVEYLRGKNLDFISRKVNR
jgi:hypothetical protein